MPAKLNKQHKIQLRDRPEPLLEEKKPLEADNRPVGISGMLRQWQFETVTNDDASRIRSIGMFAPLMFSGVLPEVLLNLFEGVGASGSYSTTR